MKLRNIPLKRLVGTVAAAPRHLVQGIGSRGLIQPIAVRAIPGSREFRIVDGRRRAAALAELGFRRAPCVVLDADPADGFPVKGNWLLSLKLSPDALDTIEANASRSRNWPCEIAALKCLLHGGEDPEAIRERLGLGKRMFAQLARFTTLADEALPLLEAGRLSISAAATLAKLPEQDQRAFLAKDEKPTAAGAAAFYRQKIIGEQISFLAEPLPEIPLPAQETPR